MPAIRTRQTLAACVASCAVALAAAAPGVALPAGPGPAQSAAAAAGDSSAGGQAGGAVVAGGHGGGAVAAAMHANQKPAAQDLRAGAGVPTGSLAGTTEANLGNRVDAAPARISAPADDTGIATLVVVLIAAAALVAGASAGFAGGRHGALRAH
jgi:hypothetical protein